jgi:arsenate reductase
VKTQIAAAPFNALAEPSKAIARSAGPEPAEHVHPVVVEAMREQGVDLAAARPQKRTPELAARAGASF